MLNVGTEVWIVDYTCVSKDIFKYVPIPALIERVFDSTHMRTQYVVYLTEKEIIHTKLLEEKDIFLSKDSAEMTALRWNKRQVVKLKAELEYLTKEISHAENIMEEY